MLKKIPTILLVDDFSVNLEVLKDILKRYHHLTAQNGEEAIALALAEPKPDLILLDVIMPGMDGYEVCAFLKSNSKTKDIPIIFLTGKNDAESVIKGFKIGAIDYITKPFNFMELKARVNTQLMIKLARDKNQMLLQKIEEINTKLTDSINYAKKIQNASMPKKEYLDALMPEYFVLLKPRDIVSGDFYWVGQVGKKLVVVAADCTGHGVPGAIMSMFGVAYLHEIVGVKGESSPAAILNELRRIIINSLQQDEDSEVKDGMDMSVITIDASNNSIEFSGAFNPLFLIRDHQLKVIPADRMPVSYGEIDRLFSNQIIPYQKGDCFYLFSDGFAAQFGGQHGKKLKQNGFQQMIIEYHLLPMKEQRKVFDDFFVQWKGANEQVDDVLLMGIRL
jgi:CheY-like chemotaxis protein